MVLTGSIPFYTGRPQDSEESSYASAQFVLTKSVSFEPQSSEERHYDKSISHGMQNAFPIIVLILH